MCKLYNRLNLLLTLVGVMAVPVFVFAQTVNDGCMQIQPFVVNTWVQEFEDPFQDDEASFHWYGADNANLDGQSWRSDGGHLYLNGSNFIGWRTIFEGGDDQIGPHPQYQLFNQTYGTANTNVTVNVPQFLQIRGSYTGDDCGGADNCTTGFFNCGGDDDDYCYDDVLTTTLNYRFGPPNQITTTTDVFTTNHGATPPALGGGSNYGARIAVNWTSPIPTTLTASAFGVCAGGSVQLTAGGTIMGGTYAWYIAGGAFLGTGATITVSPTTTTTYQVYCRNGGVNSLCYKEITITASATPISNNTISGAPLLGPFCSSGDPGLITGNTPTVTLPAWNYEWQTSIDGGATWVVVGSGTSATLPYTYNPGVTSTTLLVRRVVYSGGCDNSSNVLTYDVQQPVTSNTIAADQTFCGPTIPAPIAGSIPLGGSGTYGYQWQSASAFAGPYTDIFGQNLQGYSPGLVSATTYYRRTVTAGVCPPVNSAPVAITILPVITGNNITADQTFCVSGDPTTLVGSGTLAGGNGSFTYNWQQSTDGGNNWSLVGGATGATYDPPLLTQTTLFRRGVYSSNCFDYSPYITITIHPSITNNSISADQNNCGPFIPSTLVGTAPGGGSGAYVFQWQQSTNGGVTWANIGSATSGNYSPPTILATAQFRRVVTSAPCSDTSNAITITITPPITVNTIGSDQTFCASGDPGTLTGAVPTGGNGSFNYQWELSTNGGVVWNPIGGANGVSYAPGNLTLTTLFHRIAYSGSCNSISNTVTITVVPVITNNSISTDQTFCGNGDPAVLVGSSAGGGLGSYVYQWIVSTDNVSFSNVPSANSQSYDPGNTTVTTYYKRIVTSSACADTSNLITIAIVPVIANNVIDAYQRFCGGGDPALINGSAPTGGTGVYNYQWEESTNGGVSWTPIPLATSASYDPPSVITTTLYHRVITDGVCSSTSNTSTVRVLILPQVTQVTHVSPLCNGDSNGSITITGTSANGAAEYSIDGGSTYQTSGIFTGLAAGSYNVYIQDDSLCSNAYAGNPEVITEPALLDHTNVVTQASCENVFDASIVVNATGGTLPYSYSVNGGPTQLGNVFSGLATGNYVVQIYDAHGCGDTSHVFIDTLYGVYGSIVSQTDVSCYGGVDGSVTVQLAGGVQPYSYSSNGVLFQPSPVFNGLASGNYLITLRDSKGCTDFVQVTIAQPNQMVAFVDSVTDILCNGTNSGAIYITVTGGNGGYTFLWSNGAITEDITGLTAGTYNVAVTDSKGCTAGAGATISQPVPLFVNVASYQDLLCNGDSSGYVDVTANGGVPPYTYIWSDGEATEDITNLPIGIYTVTVTDANGCVGTATQTVIEPAVLGSTISSTNIPCAGGSGGSVDLTVTGGTPGFTYLWSNGATTEDLPNVSGGVYSVVIYDDNGCSATNSTVVAEPSALALTLVVTDVLCHDSLTGAVTLTVSGGAGGYSFAWSNGAITQNIAGVGAGTYSVVVTDANLCTASASATITEPAAIVLNATPTNVSCAGGNNGAVDITVQGGVFPYTFAWTGGINTEDISGLSGGTYDVTITDDNGCSITQSFVISEPTAIVSSIVGTNVSCFGAANGAADLTVSGGTSPYTFLWNTFQATEDLANISGGTYYVIITDANGCEKRDSVIITEQPALVLSLAVTNVLCNGALTGAIDLTVSGGAGGYTFVWSNSTSGEDITGVAAGTYSVVVTDASSCTASASATITQPAAMVINGTATNVGCNGGNNGSVDITVQGGVFPYVYSWTGGAVTEDISGLSGGTYTVTVNDANACTITASFTLTEPSAIVSSVTHTNVSCNGASDGAADLTVSGGTAPYTFLWSNFLGSQNVTGLHGGLYYVIITDDNGCEKRDSVLIDEPAVLSLSTIVTNISCYNANDGAIDLIVTGGTPNYVFAWSNGAVTEDLSGLQNGVYAVTVTDNNLCTATTSVTIINPSVITANFVVHNPLCFGSNDGSIDLIPSGGTPSYSFNWSTGANTEDISGIGGGTFAVTITDAEGCTRIDSTVAVEPGPLYTSGVIKNVTCHGYADGAVDITAYGGTLPYSYQWSTFQSTEDIFQLPGGDYYVSVTDANNCQVISLYILREPDSLTSSMVTSNVQCAGTKTGSVAVVPAGGTRPYTYLWNNFETDSLVTNAAAGWYVVQLTDSNNCFKYDSILITEPLEITITGTVTDVICFGASTGAIDITVSGGTPAYTYNWSNSTGTEDLTAIAAGTYTVTVTDVNLCTETETYIVTQGPEILPSIATYNPVCFGGSTGGVTAIVSGGVAPYNYIWNTVPASTNISVSGLKAGVYDLTVTDDQSCTASASAVLIEPAKIDVTANAVGAKCFNTATGSVIANVTGGTSPFTYLLNGVGQDSGVFSGLLPGNYLVLVTDVNGCQGTVSFEVQAPDEITVDLGVSQQVILTGMQTQLIANATSTSPIQNYIWSPDSVCDFSNCADADNCSNPFAAPLTTTTFTVTVMNEDSCFASDTVTVTVLNQPSAFIPTAFSPNDDGLNDRFEFDILGATNIDIQIFDRWGSKVYSNASQENGLGISGNGWDGKKNGKFCPYDTYVYQMVITYWNGESKNMNGTINIMK